MLRLCIFTTAIAVAVANRCMVSEWGPWTDWSGPGCTIDAKAGISYSEPVAPRADKGRIARMNMMERKEKLYDELVQKREAGVFAAKQSEGAFNCINGLAGEHSCYNIDQIAFFDFSDLCANDCGIPVNQVTSCDSWGWTDPQDGTEYAIHTMNSGTSFLRLNADYSMPTVLGFMGGFGTQIRNWRDAKVIGNYVYVGSETYDHGLQVFDLTRLRTINSYVVLQPDATYMGFGNSHNIVASESSNTIFAVGSSETDAGYVPCSGGLHAVDVSDPLNPTYAGCFDDDGYTHDAQCVLYAGPDAAYLGQEICFNFNEDSLTIVDVTDKSNMVQISRTEYDNNQYTHQGWLTDDHAMVLMDDELDEYYGATDPEQRQRTHIWDLTSLDAPVLVRTHLSELMVIDHNQYIIGDKVFQSNYEEGLRILQLDQANAEMTELGFFDVHIPASVVDFFGMWNAYPFFSSAQMVCSVIEQGLFILKPDLLAMNQMVYDGTVMMKRTRDREVLHADDTRNCPRLTEVEQQLMKKSC